MTRREKISYGLMCAAMLVTMESMPEPEHTDSEEFEECPGCVWEDTLGELRSEVEYAFDVCSAGEATDRLKWLGL